MSGRAHEKTPRSRRIEGFIAKQEDPAQREMKGVKLSRSGAFASPTTATPCAQGTDI